MKYQESKLQLEFHALFVLNTYTSLNNNLAKQFIIRLKSRLLFIIFYYQGLPQTLSASDDSEQLPFRTLFHIFALQILQTCMLFRGLLSLNCPKFTETMSFLITLHACPAFLKYALITFLFYYKSVICEDKKC